MSTLEPITELKTCLACVLGTICTQGLIIRRGHFFFTWKFAGKSDEKNIEKYVSFVH